MLDLNINTRYLGIDAIKEIFSNIIEGTHELTLAPDENMAEQSLESKFGGLPYSEGEAWPVCTSCTLPMRFIFQFDTTAHSSTKINKNCLYVFFMCDTQDGSCYSGGDSEGTWVMQQYASPALEKLQPISYPEMQPFMLSPVEPCTIEVSECVRNLPELYTLHDSEIEPTLELLVTYPMSSEEAYEEIAEKIFELPIESHTGSKYLGTPYSFNPLEIPKCSVCTRNMYLLFQIGGEDDAGFSYGDGGYIYLFYCQDHPETVSFRAVG